MGYFTKQAAITKLASLRLAINYVLRHRMTKQAADPQPIRDINTLKSLAPPATPGLWRPGSQSYNINHGDWDTYMKESDRVNGLFNQLTPAEQTKYKPQFDERTKALDSWARTESDRFWRGGVAPLWNKALDYWQSLRELRRRKNFLHTTDWSEGRRNSKKS